jgi:hypothetical protein
VVESETAIIHRHRIVWAACLTGTLVEVGAAFLMMPRAHIVEAQTPFLFPALVVCAVFFAIASVVFTRRALREAVRRATNQPTHPTPATADRTDDLIARSEVSHRRLTRARVLLASEPSFTLAVALSNNVSLIGVVTAILGFGPERFVPFLVAGTVLVATRYPIPGALFATIERMTGIQVE